MGQAEFLYWTSSISDYIVLYTHSTGHWLNNSHYNSYFEINCSLRYVSWLFSRDYFTKFNISSMLIAEMKLPKVIPLIPGYYIKLFIKSITVPKAALF